MKRPGDLEAEIGPMTVYRWMELAAKARRLLRPERCPYCEDGRVRLRLEDWLVAKGAGGMRLVARGRCYKGHEALASCSL